MSVNVGVDGEAKCLRFQCDMREIGEVSLMTRKNSGSAKLFCGS